MTDLFEQIRQEKILYIAEMGSRWSDATMRNRGWNEAIDYILAEHGHSLNKCSEALDRLAELEAQADLRGGLAQLRRLKPNEPCSHPGCLHHLSHPCGGCGRIAGLYSNERLQIELDDCKRERSEEEQGSIMKGLYQKYRIEKTDGTPVDQGAEYFVLRLDADPYARIPLLCYAYRVMNDNPELARDLVARLTRECQCLDCVGEWRDMRIERNAALERAQRAEAALQSHLVEAAADALLIRLGEAAADALLGRLAELETMECKIEEWLAVAGVDDAGGTLALPERMEVVMQFWQHYRVTEDVQACADYIQQLRERLERTMVVTRRTYCTSCGAEYPQGTRHGDIAMAEHIAACPEHPMRGVERERDAAIDEAGRLRDAMEAIRAAMVGRTGDTIIEFIDGALRGAGEATGSPREPRKTHAGPHKTSPGTGSQGKPPG